MASYEVYLLQLDAVALRVRGWFPTACIGLSLLASSQAQDYHGWIFDHRELWKNAGPLLPSGIGDEVGYWRQVWARSSRQGPLKSRQVIASLRKKTRLELRFCLLGALGLAGGKQARSEITKFLAKGTAEYRVLAAFAASRHRVAFPKEPLLKQAAEPQPEAQVVRLAARLALLASYPREAPRKFRGRVRDKQIDPILNALWGAWNPEQSLDQMSLPVLQSKAPLSGSLAELGERALLLMAATRRGGLSDLQLKSVLGRGQRSRNLGMASLALGRLHKSQGQTDALAAHKNLIRPLYLLGLGLASKIVFQELAVGPGIVRPNREKSWHWAVAARFLPSAGLSAILRALLEQPYDAELHERGIKALLWRDLVLGDKLRENKIVRALSLPTALASKSPWLLSLRVLAHPDEGVTKEVAKALGGRRAHALRMYLKRRLGNDDKEARRILWKLLQSEDWVQPSQGPGSIEEYLLKEMNQLTWDIFLQGSNFITRKEKLSTPRKNTLFFPKGIRESKEEFHKVLDAYLKQYPVFRSWPGANSND